MNLENVADHAQSIAHGAYLAIGIEIPMDGDFLDAQSFSTRKIKEFDIEGPAHQCLTRKKIFDHISAKTFKAALRIVQARQDQQTNKQVNGASTPVTVGGFVIANGPRRFA